MAAIKPEYIFFWGAQEKPYGVFSQWHSSKFTANQEIYEIFNKNIYNANLKNKIFDNCEQYMMACKALLFEDITVFNKIIASQDPKKIKSLGRQVKNFDQTIWGLHKYKIVVNCNFLKFSQDKNLKDILMSTQNKIIVEASPLDNIWGIGFKAADALANINKWGENLLGLALVEVREKLRK